MSNGFALSMGFLPKPVLGPIRDRTHGPVDPRPELNNAAPSLQLDYRAFITTTGCPAPVPRLGTLILMGTTHLDFSLRIGATGSRVPCKSPVQSHAAFMPDAVWAEIRTPPRLVPGYRLPPGFDIVDKLSTRHQRFACARLSEPYLTGSPPAFSATLPSRPGEFHPEPLTDPDVILSHHPARATERRPPPSVEKRGLFLLPVGPLPTSVTCPLRSTGITPLPCYYGAVRPCPPHRYFRPRRFTACTFSLSIVGQVLKFRSRA